MDFSKKHFSSLTSSWEFLQNTELPIFIYGMGDGALKIVKNLEQHNITYTGIFASDEFVRGHSFLNHKVQKLSEVESQYDKFVIILAFACGYDSLINKITNIAKNHIVIAPDTPVVGEEAFSKDFLIENFEAIQTVYDMFEDDFSKKTYINILSFKITGDISYLENIDITDIDCYEQLIKPTNQDIFLDLGAYNGDTVKQFVEVTNNDFNEIIAVEPNLRNYKKLSAYAENFDNIQAHNYCVWDKNTTLIFPKKAGRQSLVTDNGIEVRAITVDNLLQGKPVTYMKYDVEGAENKAIIGSTQTIKNYKPKLKIALYHRNEDVFKIPLQIKELNPNYKFYFRKHPYIPAWEINLFCI